MELAFQVAAAAIIGSILCSVLRRSEPGYGFLASVLLCAALLMACAQMLSPVLTFLHSLQSLAGLESVLFAPVYKVIAIGALTQISVGFCHDADEQALSHIVELCGMILALYTALPLAETALSLLRSLIGG